MWQVVSGEPQIARERDLVDQLPGSGAVEEAISYHSSQNGENAKASAAQRRSGVGVIQKIIGSTI